MTADKMNAILTEMQKEQQEKMALAVREFRFYEDTGGKRIRHYITVGTASRYRTATAVRKAVQALLLKITSDAPQRSLVELTLGTLMDRYIQEKLPQRYSTRDGVPFSPQPAHQTEVQRYPFGSGESDGCRRLAKAA